MKSFSRVRLFVTLRTIAHQAPSSMGILQARILEWVTISFSRGSSQPRDRTQVSRIEADTLTSEPPGNPKSYHFKKKINKNLQDFQTVIKGKSYPVKFGS